MAARLPVKSGTQVLKTFFRVRERFQIQFKRKGKGSHVVLSNKSGRNFSVPLHNELDAGTLLKVIEDAEMTKEQFLENDP
ncbi:MAG: type II toxin-antitoxin system HicA family toxin [Candidatus Bathyarchaeia archaeon]